MKESHKRIDDRITLKNIIDHSSSPIYHKKIISYAIQFLSLYSSQLLEDVVIAVMKICSSLYKLFAGSICHKFQYAEVLSCGYSGLYSLWDSQIPVQSIMMCPQAPVCIQLISAWLIQSHFVSNCHYSPKLWAGRQMK